MSSNYDVVIFTETWLKSNINDTEFLLNGYDIYRCDRSPLTNTAKTGGGVLIVVRSTLISRKLKNPDDSLEQLFLLINFGNCDLIIGTIYIPPSSDENIYEKFGRSIMSIKNDFPNAEFLIAGDLNLPNIDWSNSYMGANFTARESTRLSTVRLFCTP